MTENQFQAFLAATRNTGQGNVQRPKAKEPDTYEGAKDKLRIFLAQCEGYFAVKGYGDHHDEIKSPYVESLLRGLAGQWIMLFQDGQKQRE
jgi:hypothetical protein